MCVCVRACVRACSAEREQSVRKRRPHLSVTLCEQTILVLSLGYLYFSNEADIFTTRQYKSNCS
jgi:hypothetical protein